MDWNLGILLESEKKEADSDAIKCRTEKDSDGINGSISNEVENGKCFTGLNLSQEEIRNSQKRNRNISEYDNYIFYLKPQRNCVIGVNENFTESEDGDEILSCVSNLGTGSSGNSSKELFQYDEEFSNYIWRFNNLLGEVLFTMPRSFDPTISLIIKCKRKIDEQFLLTNYDDLIDEENITNMEEETPDKNIEAKKSNLVDSSNFCNICHGKHEKYIEEFSKKYVKEYPNLALVSDFIAKEIKKKGNINYY
ncbi:hypothetical protein TNCV_3745011 [Trichonephila clavipes]|nr:hypothetical protein TNCV_3745011 [Trichonephila clavipes]